MVWYNSPVATTSRPAPIAEVVFPGAYVKTFARRKRWGAADQAVDACRGLAHGESADIITDSATSLIDVLDVLIDDARPAALAIVVWAAYRGDTARVHARQQSGDLTGVRWVFDRGFQRRRPDDWQALAGLWPADAFRFMRVHSKMFLLDGGEGRRWVGSGSCNLNGNSRTESLHVARSDGVAGMYADFFDRVFALVGPSQELVGDPYDRSGAREAARADGTRAQLENRIANRIARNRAKAAAARGDGNHAR